MALKVLQTYQLEVGFLAENLYLRVINLGLVDFRRGRVFPTNGFATGWVVQKFGHRFDVVY